MTASGSMVGYRLTALPKRSRTYGEGRVCTHPGCITRISAYNRRETCFAHAGVKIPRLRGRVAKG